MRLHDRLSFFNRSGFNRSGFNSPKLASFLIHKVYIKCLGACPEDLYSVANSLQGEDDYEDENDL